VIVYVETNFILELAYRQERAESCDEILKMAAAREITLALPAFSAAEARVTWQRRVFERENFHEQLRKQIREVSRSEYFRKLDEQSKDVVAAFAAGTEDSLARLEATIEAVQTHGTIVALTGEIVSSARLHGAVLSLSPQDALVLASVRAHAEQHSGEKCFVSQDVKGFANPTVRDELGAAGCKVLVNFADAVRYIRHAGRSD